MTDQKPLILITNDDGYQAKGIKSLIESVVGLGEIVVVAPDGPRSGMSSAITTLHPLRCHVVEKDESRDLTVYACTGTPVDCVKLGISEILGRKPDLLISGVNHGSNAAICVIYSGTLGAAIEGCIFGVPSIGFSLTDHRADADFTESRKATRALSKQVLETGLPDGVCLNVNIPDTPLKGIKVCRQTKGKWVKEFVRGEDGSRREVFWLTGEFENHEPDSEDTDEWALAHGYVAVVPTKVDMTAHELLHSLKSWEKLL